MCEDSINFTNRNYIYRDFKAEMKYIKTFKIFWIDIIAYGK